MRSIDGWVYAWIAIGLVCTTAFLAIRNEGGVKKPYQLLVVAIVTVSYLFSLPFILGVTPQLGLDLKGGVSVVLEAKGNPSSEELDVAVDVIRSRVDALGVAEPEISRQGSNIVVDLPGVKDARRAQELIGQTAELRFRQVAENEETDPALVQVLNQILLNTQPELLSQSQTSTTAPQTTTSTTAEQTTTTAVSGSPGRSFKNQSDTETTESTQPETEDAPTPISQESTPTSVTLQCGGTSPRQVVLTGDLSKPTPREDDIAENAVIVLEKDTGRPRALCPAVLKGDIVKSADRQVDNLGNLSVGVELTSQGGRDFTTLIGSPLVNQQVAIVLDSQVISAPVINPELADGLTDNRLVITMGGDGDNADEVDNLITVLRYGKLPVVLEQQTAQKVSPTLGADQLKAGIYAGAFGLLLVIIYMLLYYRILAAVAVTGIALTGMAIYAVITWLGATQGLSLTLAGAVGLIVSLGLTVDSYIVYFEKLKDEVRQGRSIRSCLDSGFKSAFRTILAADLVSLIGAVALFYLASGSVRGFAFFLGLSTLLDLLISLCFMHPMVKLISQKESLITNRYFGIAAALDKKDLKA